MIINKSDSYKFSGNLNEVIRSVLNFFTKRFHKYKTAYSEKKKYKNI